MRTCLHPPALGHNMHTVITDTVWYSEVRTIEEPVGFISRPARYWRGVTPKCQSRQIAIVGSTSFTDQTNISKNKTKLVQTICICLDAHPTALHDYICLSFHDSLRSHLKKHGIMVILMSILGLVPTLLEWLQKA